MIVDHNPEVIRAIRRIARGTSGESVFYSACLSRLVKRDGAAAGIAMAATDGVSLWVDADAFHLLSPTEQEVLLCHEAAHIMLRHPERLRDMVDGDHRRWNIACDLAINSAIGGASAEWAAVRDGTSALAGGCWPGRGDHADMPEDQSADWYYAALGAGAGADADADEGDDAGKGDAGDAGDAGKGDAGDAGDAGKGDAGDAGDAGKGDAGDAGDAGDGDAGDAGDAGKGDAGDAGDAGKGDAGDAGDAGKGDAGTGTGAKRSIGAADAHGGVLPAPASGGIAAAAAAAAIAECRRIGIGMPSAMAAAAGVAVARPRAAAAWRDVLADYLSAHSGAKNWRRLSRRSEAFGVPLRGGKARSLGAIVVAIDTSGSVSDAEVAEAIAAVADIAAAYPCRIIAILHHCQAYGEYEWSSDDVAPKIDVISGGTEFAPVCGRIAEIGNIGDIACVVHFTDCEAYDWPLAAPHDEYLIVQPAGRAFCGVRPSWPAQYF